MRPSVLEGLPEPDAFLDMEAEEIAGHLIAYFNIPRENPSPKQYLNRSNFIGALFYNEFDIPPLYRGLPQQKRDKVTEAFMEAWSLLEREGLLIQTTSDDFFVSKRGQGLHSIEDFKKALHTASNEQHSASQESKLDLMNPRSREAVHAECEDWGENRVQAYVDTHPDDAERAHRLEWLNIKMRDVNKRVADHEWEAISPEIQRAIKASWAYGMPPMASAVYGRWWQLETWLRSLIYVELKAKFGGKWAEALEPRSESRQRGEHSYMATPDAQNRLAYTDASVLFKIIREHWELFGSSLPPEDIWAGRVAELQAIRNRISHCRRPHTDDLARLEQTLRDLNGGAFIATSTFNYQFYTDENWMDAVVDGWVRMHHKDAARLVEHADRQYETSFQLRYSRRPWTEPSIGQETISGIPGYIWHAHWVLRGNRVFDLSGFWRNIKAYHDTILMLCADPFSIEVSFSAMDDPETIADAIGWCFDAALRNTRYDRAILDDYSDYTQWQERYAELDPRVQIATLWASIDESMQGGSLFSA